MILNFKPVITKAIILERVTEEEILQYYLEDYLNFSDFIKSPLRPFDNPDKNPSFSFKKTYNGSIIWRDWGTGKYGDCFNFVTEKFNISFKEALSKIYDDMCLNNKPIIKRVTEFYQTKPSLGKKVFRPEFKLFSSIDIQYWGQFGIDLTTLVKFNVKACNRLFKTEEGEEKLLRYYTNDSPLYTYEYEPGIYKVYAPYAPKKQKFLYNGGPSIIEGYNQLTDKGKLLIITKSLKDVMCLSELGYDAISLQGEGNILTLEMLEILDPKFDNIIVFYDNDQAGREGASRIEDKYGIMSIEIPNNYNAKDISDFIKKYGKSKAKDLMENLINGRRDSKS